VSDKVSQLVGVMMLCCWCLGVRVGVPIVKRGSVGADGAEAAKDMLGMVCVRCWVGCQGCWV